MSSSLDRAAIPVILERHMEDAAFLWLLRDAAVTSPKYDLDSLTELDQRLDAHLAGLRLAGPQAAPVVERALALGEPGEVFVAAVLACEQRGAKALEDIVAHVDGSKDNGRAAVSALGWIDHALFSASADDWLASENPTVRHLALAACAVRRVDPGEALSRAIAGAEPLPRARALRAAGELRRRDLLPLLLARLEDESQECRFWAAWSAVLLGSGQGLPVLREVVEAGSARLARALSMAIPAMAPRDANSWLRRLAGQPDHLRAALIGAASSGDVAYVPTLISYMSHPVAARIAGASFSQIVGADLASLDLDADWPEGFTAGPSEDPGDENTELDADEDLPWPDPVRVAAWWEANTHRFARGQRYLCGKPISEENCAALLRLGRQPHREAAALELIRLNAAGGALFEVRARGHRQREALRVG